MASISDATVWRWLDADAIRPWRHRSWIFPRDPEFEAKAGRVLDLYQGVWQGEPLNADDFVLSADEKTSLQARCRVHPSRPPKPGAPMRVEHEYARAGALVYVAAWDVRRAQLFGRCEPRSGIVPFDQLVADVMARKPYVSANRVFWVVDNGSSHRGEKAVRRLAKRWPNVVLVHLPVHASWLNQIEIYFSILQRKVLTPNNFDSLIALEDRILASKTITRRWHNHSSGSSRAKTSQNCWTPWLSGRPHEYVTEFPSQSTKLADRYAAQQRRLGVLSGRA